MDQVKEHREGQEGSTATVLVRRAGQADATITMVRACARAVSAGWLGFEEFGGFGGAGGELAGHVVEASVLAWLGKIMQHPKALLCVLSMENLEGTLAS